MAFSTTSFHFPRSWKQVIQFLTLIWQMSCLTLSSHLYLCLPCDILVRGFHLNIFLTVLVSGILCTWPNQLSLWALIWLTIFLCFISLSNSSLVLVLHISLTYIRESGKNGTPKTKYWPVRGRKCNVCQRYGCLQQESSNRSSQQNTRAMPNSKEQSIAWVRIIEYDRWE